MCIIRPLSDASGPVKPLLTVYLTLMLLFAGPHSAAGMVDV